MPRQHTTRCHVVPLHLHPAPINERLIRRDGEVAKRLPIGHATARLCPNTSNQLRSVHELPPQFYNQEASAQSTTEEETTDRRARKTKDIT